MLRRLSVVVLLASLAMAACSTPPPPVSVEDGVVTVLNQTDQDWNDVLITVNDHFRGLVPVLKAQGRANAPLNQLQTGFGQRWASGTPVRTIDVEGKSADGTDVKLTFGRDQEKK